MEEDFPQSTSRPIAFPSGVAPAARQRGNGDESSPSWKDATNPRIRNRGYGTGMEGNFTPPSPLPRNTYTLQEEHSEASESVSTARPALRNNFNSHSMRSMGTATSSHTDFGGASIPGGVSLDSPRTPGSSHLLVPNGLDRENNVMQLSLVDASAKEVTLRPPETPTSAMRPTSLGSNSMADASNAASMVSGNRRNYSHPESRPRLASPADEDEEPGDASSEDYDDSFDPIILWGVKLPMWLSRIIHEPPFSSAKIASFVVRSVPCFWCCGDTVQGSSTDRAVLTRLIVLCIFFCFIQMTASLWLSATLLILDDSKGILAGFKPNYWNLK